MRNILNFSDLKGVVFSMVNDKDPRFNGFPYEFYKTFWDSIGPYLHKVYLEAFQSKSLGNLINKGNIKYIPKAGDPEDIYNWRPIILLIWITLRNLALEKRIKSWKIIIILGGEDNFYCKFCFYHMKIL